MPEENDTSALDPEPMPPCECAGAEHCDVVARCDECLRATCDFCGYGHNDDEDEWFCPDCAPDHAAR